jgi:hypothetical protein
MGLDEVALKKQDEASAITPTGIVPKDEIELLHDQQAIQEEATIDDLESTEISRVVQDVPIREVVGRISEDTTDLDTSLASSLDPASSGLVTPPMTTISEAPKPARPGSSLVNEIELGDKLENKDKDEGISMIAEDEEEEEEVDEPLEGDTFEDEVYGEGGDANGGVVDVTEGDYDDDEDDEDEESLKFKDPLVEAVRKGDVGEQEAIEAVGGDDKWEEYQEHAAEYENDPTGKPFSYSSCPFG